MKKKEAKYEVLDHLWKSIHKEINTIGFTTKDKSMSELYISIAKIPEECKTYILYRYIEDCFIKHSLAFFQWRKKFRKDEVRLEEIDGTVRAVTLRIMSEDYISRTVSDETLAKAKLSKDAEKKL